MPQVIQRSPLGLLSVLDSKAGGQAPNLLADLVTPTLDLQPMYGLYRRERVTASIAAAAAVVGFNSLGGLLLVPSGETWRLLNLTGNVNNVVAAGTDVAIGYSDQTGRFSMVGSMVAAATNTRPTFGGECDVWLKPGDLVGVWVSRTAIAADLIGWANFERYTL